jgi:hypothetical protein
MTGGRRLVLLAALGLAAFVLGTGAAPGASDACPASNPPDELVMVSGNAQTAKVGQQFSTLQVAFANTNGCSVTGVVGVAVDWVAPSAGAGGTFASSGTNLAVTTADDKGAVSAPAFVANDTAGTYSVRAESDYGTVKFQLTNTSTGVVASVVAVSGAGQQASVYGRYADPLAARVVDAGGTGVQGASVTFALAANQYGAGATFLGGGAQATETTDSSGLATSPPVVANGIPGRFQATATTSGIPTVVTFDLDNHAASLTLSAAATGAAGRVDARYARPLAARALDAAGAPIEGVSVTFTLTAAHGGAGASFLGGGQQATVYADADGLATSPPLVANSTTGSFTATASAPGAVIPASFELENHAGKPATVVAGAAASLSAPVRSRFPVRLAVTVTDADGNAVPGVLVTFAAPKQGASGRFGAKHRRVVRARTDARGVAVAPAFRANGRGGGYAVRASVHGVRHPAAFALVNRSR